jgi:hypothetical protein
MLFSKVKWSKGQSYMNLLGSADRYKYVIRCMFPFVGVSCFIENSMRCFNFCMFAPIYAGNALCTVKYTGEDPCMMSIIRSSSFPLLLRK